MAALALAPSIPLLAAALAVLALGQGTASPSVSTLISRQGGPGEQGRLLGVNQSLSALGRVVGPVWGGVALRPRRHLRAHPLRRGDGGAARDGAGLARVPVA
jgi:MFS family permease